jgi:N-acetyl sugar amidotransferase
MVGIKRCTRCVLPDIYPSITFDEHGVCNFCLEAAKEKVKPSRKSKAQLDWLVEKYKGRNEKYDVIIGLSGGKDSSYVAYYLKKEYGLKILGLHYNIGYSSLYAIQNLENLVEKLNLDLFSIRPRVNFVRKLFAHFLRERGEFCSVCNNLGYLFGASFSWSQRHTFGFAPLMVGGWSKQYEYQPGISVTSMQYFFDNLTPELFDELKAQPFIEKEIISRYMSLEDPRQAGIDTASYDKLGDYAMDFIQLPDYIEWNVREIPRILSEKLGWRHPPDVNESHFDCILFPIKEYIKFKKYGLTQETVKNSRLIREGLMTREEAMERMSLEQTTEPEILDGFLRELGVSRKEINWQAEWSR